METCNVAIIGAGPYGLSIAAHLKARGVDFRIFGKPMLTWLTQMPQGMRLKSEGFASCLDDPNSELTLKNYCKEKSIPYADMGLPVHLDTFANYGIEFQRRFVPNLEDEHVVGLRRIGKGFEISLKSGKQVAAREVVVAAGITHFGYVPPVLSSMPEEFVTHSSKYGPLNQFKGREVAVVGAGSSALDVAGLLHEAGAKVQLVARSSVVKFHDPPRPGGPTLLQQLRRPVTGIGFGWKLTFYTRAPLAFRLLPEATRLDLVRKTLGPAPPWFVKEQTVGKISFNLGMEIAKASVNNGRVNLELVDSKKQRRTLVVDHVIAGTGYKVDLRRLAFLGGDMLSEVQSVQHSPILSANFESSVPGLYFVGTAAANTFGPLMRFAFGAKFTARHISKHLGKLPPLAPTKGAAEPTLEAVNR
jgi:cation diffusion facilitator CzcD-associated flavoprotein CzcO